MKRYLVFYLALLSLTAVSAEVDEGEDQKTKFDSALQRMSVLLDSFSAAVEQIQEDASSTDNQSLMLAARECQDTVKQCRDIYEILNDHNTKLSQRSQGSQTEIFDAENYGQTILSKQDLPQVRGKINNIKDALPRFTWCCSKKNACKNEIKDLVRNLTSFTNSIDRLHKYTFLNLASQHRLQSNTASWLS